ncbi:MAG TPA: chemotaxis protein CheB [Pirellulaceae bacterium]|nr:chemotaxis protein CheB [Pirellulaceae bacterium]
MLAESNALTKRKPPDSLNPAEIMTPDTAAADDQPSDSVTPAARTRALRFPVVGIGASAGGLEALEALFAKMPTDTGMAFVVVTHQHPEHVSLLPDLLGKVTKLPVVEASDGLKLAPNHVYVSPPGGNLAILKGTLHRLAVATQEIPKLPIDYFFRSLAADQRERAICIILSGTGTDGTLGLKAIKAEAGMVMVEEPQAAKYAGMPASAIATGLADYVLPPAAMPQQLVAYAQGSYLRDINTPAERHLIATEPLQKILILLRARTGNDFSSYKTSTLQRRIERRMNVQQITEPTQYVRYAQENPHELDILFKELLISVTHFFRDPEAWEALLAGPLPELLQSRPDGYLFRAWVPACASGEEVYTLAICLRESLEQIKRTMDFQLFGTDLDAQAIEAARQGQYPDGIAADVGAQRLERCFVHQESGYRIRKEIREMAVFAAQNVIKDPPFTKLDFLSCRNLLIYLNADLQKRLLPVFHYALKPGGLLLLGPSETTGACADLFDVVDKHWKIYRRKEIAVGARPMPDFPAQPATSRERIELAGPVAPANASESNITRLVDKLLLGTFAPPSVVINDRGDVVCIHGRTGAYLEPTPGQPRHNVLEMAREGLRSDLAAALRQAVSQNQTVFRENIRVKTNGDFTRINLAVAKIEEPEMLRSLWLVTFIPTPPAQAATAPRKSRRHRSEPEEAHRIDELERELQRARESLRIAVEELETANEELRSTNEELQSTNEELQSTNEELETSKEEMQSLNEELTTVNTELQSKVDDLSQANNDMQNLLNSTDVATVFLDKELNIKRFTEQVKPLIMLRAPDVGRPLSELASRLEYTELARDCEAVLRTLAFKECEVHTTSGAWYLMRILPYRTVDNVIDGLVLTFVEISRLKASQASLRRMSKVFQEGADPILIVDLSGRILDVNEEAVRTYRFARERLLDQPIHKIISPALHAQMDDLLLRCRAGETLRNVGQLRVDKAGEEISVFLTLTLLADDLGHPDAIAITLRQSVS